MGPAQHGPDHLRVRGRGECRRRRPRIARGSPRNRVVVAVIDDGVDFSQPDLAGQAWVNPGESGGGKETNNVDDDANGYIDDVNGWDFCHDDKTVHDPDDDFHGTHVSGTIAAKLDGAGIVGLAPGVKLMALKFLGDDHGLRLGRPGDRGHRVREVVRRADLEQLLGSTGERAAVR